MVSHPNRFAAQRRRRAYYTVVLIGSLFALE